MAGFVVKNPSKDKDNGMYGMNGITLLIDSPIVAYGSRFRAQKKGPLDYRAALWHVATKLLNRYDLSESIGGC